MTDQFCLRWNNFQMNITSALESLKTDEDLVDVTLTCEGQTVKAHKVILSACSPYFRSVFKENPCKHPVVILKDVSYEDVTALLNFMYQGEVYITQDRLAPFLHTAELLQVKGLAGASSPFKDGQSQPQQAKSQLSSLLTKSSLLSPSQPSQTFCRSVPKIKSPSSKHKFFTNLDSSEQSSEMEIHRMDQSQFMCNSLPSTSSIPLSSQVSQSSTDNSSSPPVLKKRKTIPRKVESHGQSETAESVLDIDDSSLSVNSEECRSEMISSNLVANVKEELDDTIDEGVGNNQYEEVDEMSDHEYETGLANKGCEDAECQDVGMNEVKFETNADDTGQSVLMQSLTGSTVTRNSKNVEDIGENWPIVPHVPHEGACPHCGKNYSNQSALKYHVRLMHSDLTNRLCCHMCPRSFSHRETYKKHMKDKHKVKQ